MFVDVVIVRENDRCQAAVTCLRPAFFFQLSLIAQVERIFFYHVSPVGCTFSCQREKCRMCKNLPLHRSFSGIDEISPVITVVSRL